MEKLYRAPREASHIEFAHKNVNFTFLSRPPTPPTPLGNVKIFISIFGKDTAFSRFWYLSYAIPLPLAAIKIISKHKVVHKISCLTPDYYINNINFVKKLKKLTDEFKARVILYPFPRCFQKVQTFLTKVSSHDASHRNITAANPSPPPPPQTYNWRFLWAIDMWGFHNGPRPLFVSGNF